MTACQGHTSVCDGFDLRPVRLGLRREISLFCGSCRTAASAMGLQVVERRAQTVVVAHDRRIRPPAWLTNLRARDETGSVLS